MLNENRIRYFLVLARNKSFTKTAEQLFISQQSLSKQIAALEDDLGFPLFLRSSKGVALTESGQAMYSFFSQFSDEYIRLQGYHKDLFSCLCIGHQTGIDISGFRDVIAGEMDAFSKKRSQGIFILDNESVKALHTQLLTGGLDLAFYPAYMRLDTEGVSECAVARVPMNYYYSKLLWPEGPPAFDEPEKCRVYLPGCVDSMAEAYGDFFAQYNTGGWLLGRPPSFGAKLSAVVWGEGAALDCALSVLGENSNIACVPEGRDTEIFCAVKTSSTSQCARAIFERLRRGYSGTTARTAAGGDSGQ